MKKLLLISLICVLVFSFAITAMAKVVVTYWTYPSIVVKGLEPGEYEQKVIDQFEKEYPEIEVDFQIYPYCTESYQKVNLSIASGDPPDIIAQSLMSVGGYANLGLLVPFELTEEEENDFLPFAKDLMTINGITYVYPFGAYVNALMINRRVARLAGALDLTPLDRPDRNWTIDEFKAYLQKIASAKLKLDNREVVGMVMYFGGPTGQQIFIMTMLQSFGAELFVFEEGKIRCTVNSPEALNGLEYFLDLHKSTPGCFPHGMETATAFTVQGHYFPGVSNGSINVIRLGLEGNQEIAKCEYALVPFPSIEGVPNAAMFDSCVFGVFDNGDEEKIKAAQIFVRYFIDNAPNLNSANCNSLPSKKSLPLPMREYKDNPEVQYSYGVLAKLSKDFGASTPVYAQFKDIFRIAMSGVFMGEITAKEGLDEVANKTNKLLDEFYADLQDK